MSEISIYEAASLEGWDFIRPSHTQRSSCTPPPLITRQGIIVDFDSHHAVQLPKKYDINQPKYLHVYLCGTGCHPSKPTAFAYLNTSLALGYPTIALSYIWANYTDMEKNTHAKHKQDPQDFLRRYHHDCVNGGSLSKLVDVPSDQSIMARLADLINYLIKESSEEEAAAWSYYLTEAKVLRYDRIIISGHSQGAGHVAYIAQQHGLARAILLSGPQEYINEDDHTSYLDEGFVTKDVRCFRHQDEEGTALLIDENWRHMRCLQHHRLLRIDDFIKSEEMRLLCVELPWRESYAAARPFTISHAELETISHRDYALFISKLHPENSSLSARPCHNSTVQDQLTPRPKFSSSDPGQPIYSLTIWRWLLEIDHELSVSSSRL
jgi:hypothetical protein